ncbi:NTP transferase domain-containing protein [Patescibacteria group bacterium]|jgi:UTP--glucose-1-phosphate uridylyltransferase|nr:NTP transferase domain-containing protein [Patescibacteria group bacterium]
MSPSPTPRKVRKAIIPAAGLGTRFLPQTKAMPKEMLPIVDKPVIQYVVEECVESGIEDIIIVTGYHKRSIEDHFDNPSVDLTSLLESAGEKKRPLLEEIKRISSMANFIYIRQKGGYGNATPVKNARHLIGDEPFVAVWGDEFIHDKKKPRVKQCIDAYERYGNPVISGIEIKEPEHLSRYGIADVSAVEGNVYKINKIVEKPEPGEAPSSIATHGCYVLTPDIFDILDAQKPGTGGEYYLPEAIDELRQRGTDIYTAVIENGVYYDTGNKLEYMKTVVEFALEHPDLNGEFRKYLKGLEL